MSRRRAWEIGATALLLLACGVVTVGFVDAKRRNDALSLALDRQQMAQVKTLIRQGADPNTRSPRGNRALTWAAAWPDEAFAAELLDRGAQIDAPNERGNTPLMVAAGWGYPEMVKLLLQRGANPSLKDSRGRTAMQFAQEFLVGMQTAGPHGSTAKVDPRVAAAKRHVEQITALLRRAEAKQPRDLPEKP